jgi:glucose/arabinose dehydrogenase
MRRLILGGLFITGFLALATSSWALSLKVPAGFSVKLFAKGLGGPRLMAVSPQGELFVTDIQKNRVVVLADKNRDGVAEEQKVFAQGLNLPHGIAFFKNWLYVAETGRVVRYAYRPGQVVGAKPEVVVDGLPPKGQHFTRTIAFGPDNKLYVSVGSSCNSCKEENPDRATILQYNPDGSGKKIYARGLRNAVGLIFDAKGNLWATSNGRDHLGDNIPPDELHRVTAGMQAGWPFCHAGVYPDPDRRIARLGTCAEVSKPAWNFQAHSAPLGLAAYQGKQFPPDYQGDLIVAFHGSWNRSTPTGYKLVRAHVEAGKVTKVTDFITGWLDSSSTIGGRPVDVVNSPDGGLWISDDEEGKIYKITYQKP